MQQYSFSFLFLSIVFSCSIAYSQELHLFHREYQAQDYELFDLKKNIDSASVYQFLEKKKQYFRHNSYISAGYDSIYYDNKNNIFCAYLTVGKKYFWEDLIPDSLDKRSLKIFNRFKIKDSPIDYNLLYYYYENVLEYFNNSGYPFASINLDEFVIYDSLFRAKINIDKGDLYFFDSIIIRGEANIKDYYLHNYLDINKGNRFSMKKINDIDRLLNNLSFIEQSRNYEIAFIDNKSDIILYLKNKKSNRFDGIIGILPNNETTEKLLITGDLNLLLQNSFGRGELLSFQWQRTEKQSQNLNTEALYPYILRSRLGVGINFNMEKKDTSYLNTDMKLRLRYLTYEDNGFDVFYQVINSYILSKQDSYYSNINTSMGGLSYKYARLDNVLNPRKGVFLNISSSLGIRTVSDTPEKQEEEGGLHSRNFLYISNYFPLHRYFSLKLKNNTFFMYSKKLYDNELLRIGGLNNLRGFDELSIPVSSYSVSSIELRYLFEKNSALFCFYDIGYIEKRHTKETGYNFTHGIGIGLNLQTTVGVFSMVYANGTIHTHKLDLNNSKIHVGYKNFF